MRDRAHCLQPGRSDGRLGPAPDAAAVDTFDVEVELERAELAQLLDRALGLLPPPTRTALVEKYIRESPQAEIAARLGVSEGAVEVRLHRGKLALRRLLATELRQDAIACGVAPRDSEDWREARIWCPLCGQRRLSGRLTSDGSFFALRCPGCCPTPDSYVAHADGLPHIFAGVTAYRPALTRLKTWAQDYYRRALAEGTVLCSGCGRPLPVRRSLPGNHDDQLAPPSCRT